jgi:UDP-N-acetylglucosamine acyltransferase
MSALATWRSWGRGRWSRRMSHRFVCVSGDRARLHGLNRVGLRRARFDAELRERLARAVRALYAAPTIAEGVDALAADGREEPLVAQLASFALSSTRGLCRPLRSRAA